MSANISWLVYEDEVFMPYNTYMADGTYSSGDVIKKRIQIWNNHNGIIEAEDALNSKLVLAFKQYEDNFLLNLIQVKLLDTNETLKPNINIDRATYELGTLYGNAGGTYKEIEITIGPIPKNLRSELKSLIFYLEY